MNETAAAAALSQPLLGNVRQKLKPKQQLLLARIPRQHSKREREKENPLDYSNRKRGEKEKKRYSCLPLPPST